MDALRCIVLGPSQRCVRAETLRQASEVTATFSRQHEHALEPHSTPAAPARPAPQYYYCHHSHQQLSKRLMGMRLVRSNGNGAAKCDTMFHVSHRQATILAPCYDTTTSKGPATRMTDEPYFKFRNLPWSIASVEEVRESYLLSHFIRRYPKRILT